MVIGLQVLLFLLLCQLLAHDYHQLERHFGLTCSGLVLVETIEQFDNILHQRLTQWMKVADSSNQRILTLPQHLMFIKSSIRPIIWIGGMSAHLDEPAWILHSFDDLLSEQPHLLIEGG